LLGQVQRLLAVAKNNNTLPKYLVLENVKPLVGKKFKPQFDSWCNWLDSIGYNTYYEVLNGKHYGVPQNRERVFAISIRKDIDIGFKFSETIPLQHRLKDILEKHVDEKYYINNEKTEALLAQLKDKLENSVQTIKVSNQATVVDGFTDEAGTLMARDWKGFGNQAMTAVVEPQIDIVGNYMPSNHDASRIVSIDGLAPTVKENHGTVTAILEPFIVASRGRDSDNPDVNTEQKLEPNMTGCTNTITSVQKDNWVAEPTRLGNIYGEQFGTGYAGNVWDTNGISPALMTMQGGNRQPLVVEGEPIIYDDYNSRIPQDQEAITTLTTNCGASALRNGVKIIESIVCEQRCDEGIRLFKDDCVGTLRTIDACGDKRVLELYEPEIIKEDIVFPVIVRKYDVDVENLKKLLKEHKNYTNKEIAEKLNVPLTQVEHWFRQDEYFAIPDANIWFELKSLLNISTNEFDESITTFEVKDGVYDKSNRCYHINGIAPTLTVACGNEKIFEPSNMRWRIRKLTEKECWRLMGFSDEDVDRAAKFVSASALYKQAGNSIITACLVSIFYSLLFNDNSTEWTKYIVDFNS
jgi:site-specific DNA-cytosine methylase